jgi:NADPH-dependent ferric siderophore reductase
MSDTLDTDAYAATTHIAGVCEVVRAELITPLMRRITLQGEALRGLDRYWRPEMLLRLYFPPPGHSDPPEPFITPEGNLDFRTTPETVVSPFSAFSEDPLVRAFTARRFNPETLEVDVDFVLHEAPGLAGGWARNASLGDRIGIVEFALPPGHQPATAKTADTFLLFADEAALPAIQTNLEAFPAGTKVIAFIEVPNKDEEQPIETKADLTVTWLHRGDAVPGTSGLLQRAVQEVDWPEGQVFAWVCGEIKMVADLRRYFREEKNLKHGVGYKAQAYWRRGKSEVERMARMTELSLQAAQTDPDAFMRSFEEIGMTEVDPTWDE